MSTNLEEEADDMMMYCASCGTAEVDDIKLKTCTACKSARYCSVKCQRDHRPQHKRACKKRAAKLRDEILFKQPESSNEGDCPICFLPLSLDQTKSTMMTCCSKVICGGCYHSNEVRIFEEKLKSTCPFCRHPAPTSEEENEENIMKRVELNDPAATLQMSIRHNKAGDYDDAFRYANKAAELGDAGAHFQLACLFGEGKGVEKDAKKKVYHLEQAAIGGHAIARHNLGCKEKKNGRMDRAIKHMIIAAKLGHDVSLDALKDGFRGGMLSKEDFAATLRAHQ
eukprot:CAMPEP_0113403492 /NCGR_PEP_ID=MMETSP0013_2-20120614/17859_1 /TAXON_ID=2843 ORGANISM="Skeletonema costatum, Strain 1716" /NCGR_SAMPLE_ID=MMETSP0013_2 /ASSEMBLY_ACC=CAM_ASM_000158 /LENGTH=281 /DNA_ID=CAMNT_0000288979 /DNA_START=96 /DNA_END=938 /DNA_ORIENTATION=+ /assembly_acc=CAM_ASM_000158